MKIKKFVSLLMAVCIVFLGSITAFATEAKIENVESISVQPRYSDINHFLAVAEWKGNKLSGSVTTFVDAGYTVKTIIYVQKLDSGSWKTCYTSNEIKTTHLDRVAYIEVSSLPTNSSYRIKAFCKIYNGTTLVDSGYIISTVV